MGASKKIFNSRYFKAVKHQVVMVNDTSKTDVSDPEKIKIIEFHEKGCVLKVPFRSCAKGHMLSLFILDQDEKLKMVGPINARMVPNSVNVICKVETVEDGRELEEKFHIINVKFIEYVKAEWVEIIGAYIDRQNEIFKLFQKINS